MRYREIVIGRLTNGWHDRHPDGVAQPHLIQGRIFGRILECTICRRPEDLLEASSPTLGPHQHVDPRTWVCFACVDQQVAARDAEQAA